MPIISDEILDRYYDILEIHLRTGLDRITPSAFVETKSAELGLIKNKFTRGSYRFKKLKEVKINKDRTVLIPTIRDRIAIEFLKDRLKSRYRVKYTDRDFIIRSIKSVLETGMSYHVLRLDIKKFFPSIPQQKLLGKLKSSSMLSYEEYAMTKNLIKLSGKKGVPQGLSVSNILSEIYLEKFDLTLRRIHPRINFFFRFVDDIILVINGTLTSKEKDKLDSDVNELFASHGLKINKDEGKYISRSFSINSQAKIHFDYLGYRFSNKDKKLLLSISTKKFDKIVDRIDRCFEEFEKDPSLHDLLVERLKYLVSRKRAEKHVVQLSRDQKITICKKRFYFGVIENYKHIGSDHSDWKKLDKYIEGKIKNYKHRGLLTDGRTLRRLYSCSFSRFAKSTDILKLDKLSVQDLSKILHCMFPSAPLHYFENFSQKELLKKYFENVDLKEKRYSALPLSSN